MTALGQKATSAAQQAMSVIPPISTAKADIIFMSTRPSRRGGANRIPQGWMTWRFA